MQCPTAKSAHGLSFIDVRYTEGNRWATKDNSSQAELTHHALADHGDQLLRNRCKTRMDIPLFARSPDRNFAVSVLLQSVGHIVERVGLPRTADVTPIGQQFECGIEVEVEDLPE